MFRFHLSFWLLMIVSGLATIALGIYLSGGTETLRIQSYLKVSGHWAPLVYIILYVVATTLILPSTALNLAGGAIFGPWIGTLWTSVAAILAALFTFLLVRKIGREVLQSYLPPKLKTMDREIYEGGISYVFAIRLLPVIPYGIVNFAAGLTSINFRDYFWGTLLGTVPGVFPFVLLGSSGLTAVRTGQLLPLLISLVLISALVGGATWYRRHHLPRKNT